jgi:hypothetical protein
MFTVTRTGVLGVTHSVNFAVTGSGATPAQATDFVGGVFPTGQVSFAANETSKVITVNIVGDRAFESNEQFSVTLSGATGSALIGTGTATGTIQDDDTCLTGGPFVAGPNRLTYSCASTTGAFVGFVVGTRAGSTYLAQYGVTVAIADPSVPALVIADNRGVATILINLTAAQVSQYLIFQAFEVYPTRSVGPVLTWNPYGRADVDRDGVLTSLDALHVVNQVGRQRGTSMSEGEQTTSTLSDYDVNEDGYVSSLDVLAVINAMNRRANTMRSSSQQAAPLFTFDDDEHDSRVLDEELLRLLAENQ